MANHHRHNTQITTNTCPSEHLPLVVLKRPVLGALNFHYAQRTLCPLLSSPFQSSDWSKFHPSSQPTHITDIFLSFQPLQHPSEPKCQPNDGCITFLQNTGTFNHHKAQKLTRRPTDKGLEIVFAVYSFKYSKMLIIQTSIIQSVNYPNHRWLKKRLPCTF